MNKQCYSIMNNERQFANQHLITKERNEEMNVKSFIDSMRISHISQENQKNEGQDYEQIYDTISQDSNPRHSEMYRKCQVSQISQIFRHIQNPVDYERMQLEEICIEKQMLQDHIKFINIELNEMMKKKINKISDGLLKMHKGNKNNSRLKYNQWDDAGIEMQINNNHKLILMLRDQYSFLCKKLNKFNKPEFNIKYSNKIRQITESINQIKNFIAQRKRKNVMNSKKIKNYDKNQSYKVLFDCQQDYIKLSKKKEQYQKRLDKISQDNSKAIQVYSKAEHEYEQLKKQAIKIIRVVPISVQNDHNKVMYDTKCRKLQLCLKKGEREQQSYKRKYYNLLKQYENKINTVKVLDQKLNKILAVIEDARNKIDMTSKVTQREIKTPNNNYRKWKMQNSRNSQQSSNSSHGSIKRNQQLGFLLTQLNDKSFQQKKHNNPTNLKYYTEPNEQRFKRSHSDAVSGKHHKKLLPLNFNRNNHQGQSRQSRHSRNNEISIKNSNVKDRPNSKSFIQNQVTEQIFQWEIQKNKEKDLYGQETQRKAQKREHIYR